MKTQPSHDRLEKRPEARAGANRTALGSYKKGRKRLQDILDCAMTIIQRDGPSNFSMRRVADEAGITLATLQHYFPSKELLMKGIGERFLQTYHENLNEIIGEPHPTPQARLEALIELEIKMSTTDTVLYSVLSECQTNSPAMRDSVYDCYKHHLKTVITALEPLTPHLTDAARKVRAALLISSFESLGIFLGPEPHLAPRVQGLKKAGKEQLLQFAMM